MAAVAQIVFVRLGAGRARVGQTAQSGMSVLRGLPVTVMCEIAEEAWEPVLRPLVYCEAIDLAESHRMRGQPVFIVSTALQEVVDVVARELGFDGAIASRAEVSDGVYTGHLERRLDGVAKAEAVEKVAGVEGLDLTSSTAYSDSYSDIPFLEAVGRPVAVNPDRALRRVAGERGWPIRHFRTRLGTT